MEGQIFVYIMTNSNKSFLYIGVTDNLVRRVAEHKVRINRKFSNEKNCQNLVYYEQMDNMKNALAREKQLTNWKRLWKIGLINQHNKNWRDLSDSIGVTTVEIKKARALYLNPKY